MQVMIRNVKDFGTIGIQGVHQIVEDERDIDNAIDNAERDGFNRIIFYFSYPAGWMGDHDFRALVEEAKSKPKLVEAWLKDNEVKGIDPYQMLGDDGQEECNDTHFGTCDITGIQGAIVTCVAYYKDGTESEVEIGHWLIHGQLGSLMGWF